MQTVPLWVIGGYLGAGKTTLLNALLRSAGGVRYAVLVNDFGSVNVDAALIAGSGAETLELTNGCTCCTIGADLVLALRDILARGTPPDRIVIEASGVADPRAVARLAAAHPAVQVRGTIVVADATAVIGRAGDKFVGALVRRQLAAADALVLSKVDQVQPGQLATVRSWIAQAAPNVPTIESSETGIAAEILFDLTLQRGCEADEGSEEPADSLFTSMIFRSTKPLQRERFLEAVREMVPSISRAKGVLAFAGDVRQRFVFQLSGKHWSIEPFAGPQRPALTEIVAIATVQQEPQLTKVFSALTRAEAQEVEAS